MTNPLADRDLLDVDRYVDSTLPTEARAAFEARLATEPALAEALREAQQLRAVFLRARAEPTTAVRAGFGVRVMQRLEREAGVQAGLSAESERRVVALARACLLAAAAIFAVAVLFATGVLRPLDSGRLQADDERQIQELDRRIQAGGGFERR